MKISKIVIGIGIFIGFVLIGGYLVLSFIIYTQSDRSTANKIPAYPNADSWEVSSLSGFPDGSPSTEIRLFTDDNVEDIMRYYKDYFLENGWEMTCNEQNLQLNFVKGIRNIGIKFQYEVAEHFIGIWGPRNLAGKTYYYIQVVPDRIHIEDGKTCF